jgi:hypothetical protein
LPERDNRRDAGRSRTPPRVRVRLADHDMNMRTDGDGGPLRTPWERWGNTVHSSLPQAAFAPPTPPAGMQEWNVSGARATHFVMGTQRYGQGLSFVGSLHVWAPVEVIPEEEVVPDIPRNLIPQTPRHVIPMTPR